MKKCKQSDDGADKGEFSHQPESRNLGGKVEWSRSVCPFVLVRIEDPHGQLAVIIARRTEQGKYVGLRYGSWHLLG